MPELPVITSPSADQAAQGESKRVTPASFRSHWRYRKTDGSMRMHLREYPAQGREYANREINSS